MESHGIFRPVLPEIDPEGCRRLALLVRREEAAGTAPDPVRRLAALLPCDPDVAEEVAARLRLSNEERRRLRLAADRGDWRVGSAWQRGYGIGADAARDRLLLGEEPIDLVRQLHEALLTPPPSPVLKGSDLIAMGVPKGPLVAKTLQAVHRQWVEEDFPPSPREREIAQALVDQLLRDSQ
jgi:poly(A) polymerase